MSFTKKSFLSLVVSLIAFNMFAIEAKVLSVTGKAQVQQNNVWRDLKTSDIIRKGDLIQTGFKSELVIALTSNNENSKITVSQLSRITIEQLVETKDGDKTSVYLTTGSVKSEIKKVADHRANYTVRSPVATASVRGTELTVKNTFLSTGIDTHEGIVSTWKTKNSANSPTVINDNSTDDSSLFENKNQMLVAKNQSVSFSEHSKTTVRETAHSKSSTLNAMTYSASAAEVVTPSIEAQKSSPTWTNAKNRGNLVIEIKFQDQTTVPLTPNLHITPNN